MTWLFMFREHRRLYERCRELERQVAQLTEQCEKLSATPPQAEEIVTMLRDHVFAEQPWPNNTVPDPAWLTPPYPNTATA